MKIPIPNQIILFVVISLTACGVMNAQAPATPAGTWSGNFAGGFAFTDGNSDTRNFNVSFAATRDPKTKNIIKWTGLYLRGDKDGAETIDRATTTLRDEYTLSPRVFTFGQLDYLRDRFKEIMFLWSPIGGIGYKLINKDNLTMSIDNGIGGVWERNPGLDTRGSGAYNAGERVNWKLSKTAAVNQAITGLWKTQQFSDALYNTTLGIAASVTQNTQIKFEINDIYKARPTVVTLRKNDVAVITAFVIKFQ
jgi:putative salt-induced outer membrane protein